MRALAPHLCITLIFKLFTMIILWFPVNILSWMWNPFSTSLSSHHYHWLVIVGGHQMQTTPPPWMSVCACILAFMHVHPWDEQYKQNGYPLVAPWYQCSKNATGVIFYPSLLTILLATYIMELFSFPWFKWNFSFTFFVLVAAEQLNCGINTIILSGLWSCLTVTW